MNQLEQFREQCINVAQQYANNAYNNSSQNAAMEIRDLIRALPLPEVNQKPDAWLCTDLDGHFGFGFDKKLAKQNAGYDCDEFYPLYFLPPDAEALRKENEQLCQDIKVLQKRIRNLWSLIRDDAFAITFQSMGQYREALLKELPEYQANHDFQKKKIFIVWSNTDLTEGRGNEIPVAYCEKQATAKRLAKKKGVMGSDASVKPYKSIFHDGTWVAPFDMTPSTREDDEAQKKMDAYNKAAEKARAAGLSDFDLALLKGGAA